jgi:hypothetical protein
MVQNASPLQGVLATGTGTIQGSSLTSNVFYLGSTSVGVGNYLKIVGRWQSVTARVVDSPSLGIAVLDTELMVDDPLNGHIPWTLQSAVAGVALTIHPPTNAKMYRLTMSGLLTAEGDPFDATAQWTATVAAPTVVSAEYITSNGNVLLTFSDVPLESLLSPDAYSISGPTSVEVTSVRTAGPTQVTLLSTGFGTGTYTITVSA